MQEPELPAWSREWTAGRREGDHSSLMWFLWLERQVCPRLEVQGGLSTHPSPNSAPSGFEAAVCLQLELLTPGITILPLQDPKLSHQGAEQEDSQAPLQMSFLEFVSHQPRLLGLTRDSVSLCCSSIVLPIQKSTVCQCVPPWLQTCVQHLSPQHFWSSLRILML